MGSLGSYGPQANPRAIPQKAPLLYKQSYRYYTSKGTATIQAKLPLLYEQTYCYYRSKVTSTIQAQSPLLYKLELPPR